MRTVSLLVLLTGCASGAQTWLQVVDNHALLSASVVCWALLCAAWLIRGPVRVHIEAKNKASPSEVDEAAVVAGGIKRAIDGEPPPLTHPPSHYITMDPRSPR